MQRVKVVAPPEVLEELGEKFHEFERKAKALAEKYDLLDIVEWRAFVSELRLAFEEMLEGRIEERPQVLGPVILARLPGEAREEEGYRVSVVYQALLVLFIRKSLLGLRRRLEEARIVVNRTELKSKLELYEEEGEVTWSRVSMFAIRPELLGTKQVPVFKDGRFIIELKK